VRAGRPLAEACADVLRDVARLGGRGGCAALDARGAWALPFTAPGMFRGRVRPGDPPQVAVFPDERPGASVAD